MRVKLVASLRSENYHNTSSTELRNFIEQLKVDFPETEEVTIEYCPPKIEHSKFHQERAARRSIPSKNNDDPSRFGM